MKKPTNQMQKTKTYSLNIKTKLNTEFYKYKNYRN